MKLSRRTMLRGGGLSLALPFLEVMEARAQARPVRLLIFNTPNGFYRRSMVSSVPEMPFSLAPTLRSLDPYKSDLLVLSGIDNHDRASGQDAHSPQAEMLTGGPTSQDKIVARPSYDQFLSSRLRKLGLRRKSLELSTRRTLNGQASKMFMSWTSTTNYIVTPQNPDPHAMYLDLFGASDPAAMEAAARAIRHRKGLVDFVLPQAKSLNTRLGREDQARLAEYLQSLTEVQRQLALPPSTCGKNQEAAFAYPAGSSLEKQMDLIGDLVVLAFQCDLTRLVTWQSDIETVRMKYGFITPPATLGDGTPLDAARRDRLKFVLGSHEYHNGLSHYSQGTVDGEAPNSAATAEERILALRCIEEWNTQRYARVVGKLKALPGEGGGTLLDNCMAVYTGSMSHGATHDVHDLPIVVAGRGGGIITPGRHLRVSGGTSGHAGSPELFGRSGLPGTVYAGQKIDSLWVTLGDALGIDTRAAPGLGEIADTGNFWATRARLNLR